MNKLLHEEIQKRLQEGAIKALESLIDCASKGSTKTVLTYQRADQLRRKPKEVAEHELVLTQKVVENSPPNPRAIEVLLTLAQADNAQNELALEVEFSPVLSSNKVLKELPVESEVENNDVELLEVDTNEKEEVEDF